MAALNEQLDRDAPFAFAALCHITDDMISSKM